jgi:hypothetical protein
MADSQKIWKYLSISLMALLAIGVMQPQAFAMTDSLLKKKLAEIWTAINGLTEKTDDLQTQINEIALIPGDDGLHCWDTNGDGVKDASEDVNNDGEWDALDCRGAKGEDGSAGTNGSNGLNCWDLNGDGVQDAAEDINNDNDWDALDCQGSSSGFPHNTAPVVDAGNDQTLVGVATVPGSGGVPIFCPPGGCPALYSLSCQFDLEGDVQDDGFTGYLTHKWIAPPTFISPGGGFAFQLTSEDDLNTSLMAAAFSPEPFTSLPVTVTLTADDGILETDDEVELTCEAP